MAIDHVRFCATKYLRDSRGYRSASVRPDLALTAREMLSVAKLTQAGDVLGVQMTDENSENINFVVAENGIFAVGSSNYTPYRDISDIETNYEKKDQLDTIGLLKDDGSSFDLEVKSGHGKLRDAFAVSAFLGAVRARLKDAIPAYRPG